MAVEIEVQGNTTLAGKANDNHFKRRRQILTETKREPPHTTLRGITGSFASSEQLFD